MNKIKKILVSAFCILSVFMTILSIGVCAAGDSSMFIYMWTKDLTKFSEYRGGKYLKTGFLNSSYSFATYVKEENKDAYKYTSCTAFTYRNKEYLKYGSTKRGRGTGVVVSSETLVIDGHVQKVESYGEIKHNSYSNSGNLERGMLVVYRDGSPIEDKYKKYKVY